MPRAYGAKMPPVTDGANQSTPTSDDECESYSDSEVPQSSDIAMKPDDQAKAGSNTERNRRRRIKRKRAKVKKVDPDTPDRIEPTELASMPQGTAHPVKVKLMTKNSEPIAGSSANSKKGREDAARTVAHQPVGPCAAMVPGGPASECSAPGAAGTSRRSGPAGVADVPSQPRAEPYKVQDKEKSEKKTKDSPLPECSGPPRPLGPSRDYAALLGDGRNLRSKREQVWYIPDGCKGSVEAIYEATGIAPTARQPTACTRACHVEACPRRQVLCNKCGLVAEQGEFVRHRPCFDLCLECKPLTFDPLAINMAEGVCNCGWKKAVLRPGTDGILRGSSPSGSQASSLRLTPAASPARIINGRRSRSGRSKR